MIQLPAILVLVIFNINVIMCHDKMPDPSHEEHLRNHLFEHYNVEALPDKLTNVSVRLTIRHIDMNEGMHAMEVDGWLAMKWYDPRLKWKTGENDEITKLGVHPKYVWKPDLSLYNNANANNDIHFFADTNVIIFADGKVMWVPPAHLKAACIMDLTYWPYDIHNCSAKFGSWIYSGLQVDLYLMDHKPKIDLTEIYEGENTLNRAAWKILETDMKRAEKIYECCPEPYVDVSLRMKIQRNAPTYMWTVQLPVVVLCLMTIVVFLLPPGAKEKIIFGGINLFLNFFFIEYIARITEASPSHPPLIVKLAGVQLVLTAASIIISAVVTRFVQAPYLSQPPAQLKKIISLLASCLFISSYKKSAETITGFTRTTMKADDVELNDGAAHLYGEGSKLDPINDWTVLGAVIDRLCLVAYSVIFILNMLSFISVL